MTTLHIDRRRGAGGPPGAPKPPGGMPFLVTGLGIGFMIGLSYGPTNGRRAPPPVPTPVIKPAVAVLPPGALDRAVAAGRPVRIGVFGDSFGDGAWAALSREFAGLDAVRLQRESQVGAGLTHAGGSDLLRLSVERIAAAPVDVAVVSLGANDLRGIAADGHVLPFGSGPWTYAYGDRVERLARHLGAGDVQVYWLGLPRFRDPGSDQDRQVLEAVVQARLSRLSIPFLSTESLSSDAESRYAAYLPDAVGQLRLMRAPDGEHMTSAGYDRLAAPLAARIRRQVSQAQTQERAAVGRGTAPASHASGQP